jgi:hypothetical protein
MAGTQFVSTTIVLQIKVTLVAGEPVWVIHYRTRLPLKDLEIWPLSDICQHRSHPGAQSLPAGVAFL